MGTTLTGTTPQTTYDSLIKVTDNGPLGGSLKTLTDGLGNDSALALSTGAASVTGTLAVSSNLTVDTDTLFVDAANNRVGIGTTANYSFNDDAKLAVANTSGNSTISIVSGSSSTGYLAFADGTTGTDRYTGSINYTHASDAMTFHTNAGNERMRITSAGNVGIGTSSPQARLEVASGSPTSAEVQRWSYNTANPDFSLRLRQDVTTGLVKHVFDLVNNSTTYANNLVLTNGNVGIGTSSPARVLTLKNNVGATNGISFQSLASTSEIAAIECNQNLDTIDFEMVSNFAGNGFRFLTGTTLVERARFTANGLTFNGDTAAANALDDYEEGTWTPTISFGGASVGVTYAAGNAGQYTKIGRQVTVTAYILLTSKGTSTGAARIGGLPFTIANASGYYAAGSLGALVDITYGGQIQTYAEIGTTNYVLNDYSEAGVQGNITDADFTNASQILFTATYFV